MVGANVIGACGCGWVDAGKIALQQGAARVRLISARTVRKVRLEIKIRITNVGSAHAVAFQSWNESATRRGESVPTLLDNIKDLEADEKVGVAIVRRAIEEPTRQLADNAGKEGALVVEEVKKRKGNEGYDVSADEYTDLVKAGIVDPTKVTRSALQNAASISGLLLTTEALVTELPEKEKTPPMPGGGMGGMGGMDY